MMFLSLLCSHMAFGPVHMASQLRPAIHARAASSPSMLLDGSTFQLLADAILLVRHVRSAHCRRPYVSANSLAAASEIALTVGSTTLSSLLRAVSWSIPL